MAGVERIRVREEEVASRAPGAGLAGSPGGSGRQDGSGT